MTDSARKALLMTALLLGAPSLFAQAPFTLFIVDPPGVGFNDTTPAVPAGGNNGKTIGEQRLNALKYAAAIWSSKLNSPAPVRIRSSFQSLPCTARTGTLAATSIGNVFYASAPHAEYIPDVWYPASLANRISGKVLDPDTEEIEVIFNADVGQPDCILGAEWYYGLDNRAPEIQADMITTALHELAHGLGFTTYTAGFNRIGKRGDIFSQYLLDTSTGKTWNQMTDAERQVSASNTRGVVWTGVNTRNDVPNVLRHGTPKLRISSPASIAGDYYVATASIGPPLAATGVTASLAIASDAANNEGPSATDACSPLLNPAEVSGRIAVADRGTCLFAQKARNVQAAGAIGLVVVNNVAGTAPIYITGSDPVVTIPVVHVMQSDGNVLKKALAEFQTVTVSLLSDPAVLAGADPEGRPILFNPVPTVSQASMVHWDPISSPNQLMEPDIAVDLSFAVELPYDLTLSVMRDLGWFSDFDGVPDGIDQCPGSDSNATVVIKACDSKVPNTTFATGCRISDYYKWCQGLPAHSWELSACIVAVGNQLVHAGKVASRQASDIQACVAPVYPPVIFR